MLKATTKNVAAAVSAVVVTVAGLASPATAAPQAQQTVTGKVTRYQGAALRPVTSVTGTLRQKMNVAGADYVESRARRGSNIDTRTISVVTDPEQTAIVATGADEVVDSIDVGSVDGANIGVGVRTHLSEKASKKRAVPVIGFAAAPSAAAYVEEAAGFHTVTAANDADIQIGGTVNFVESWYWKYVLPEAKESASFGSAMRSGSDFWIYARRGLADARSSGTNLVDLTVRARPWGGTAGRFKQMLGNAPAGTATSCSELGAIGFGYGPASVKIGRTSCASVRGVTSTGSPYEFGADWDGKTTAQIGVEAIASYRVDEGYTPSFADYVWATFDPGVLSSNKDVKWTDTGW